MKYLIIVYLLIISACNGPLATFEFHSGEIERSNNPVFFKGNIDLKADTHYYFENIENGKQYPVQVVSENEWITIFDYFPANSFMVVELKKGDQAKSLFPKVGVIEGSEGVEVTIDGKPILFYQSETAGPVGNLPEYYNRSGFIHPLYSPNGEILTDDFPIGHTHQNALFNAWTNTTFKGKKVDFWNRHDELGTIKHSEIISIDEGMVISQIRTKLSHISLEHGEILNEEWLIKIYPTDKYYMFDLWSEQTNTSQDTLFLNEYIYGGMAFRGSKSWNRDDKENFTDIWEILTSEGYTNETANHTKAAWVDASGTINGNKAGLTVFGFPDNFRAPQTVRVHPEMPYWVYSPVVEGAFYIAPGQKYISRYRYLTHDGSIDKAEFDRVKADMEQPVVVRQIEE